MKIRTRLTIQFISIVALILLAFSISVYFVSADYRQDDFYNRLHSKGSSAATLLLAVEEIDAGLLKKIEKDNPTLLPQEIIVIYNYQNEVLYNSDDADLLNINDDVLDRVRLDGELRYQVGQTEVLGFLFTDRYDRFVVIAGAVDIYGLNKLKNLRLVLLTAYGVSILIIIFFGWIFSGRAMSPISDVIEQVDNISITSLDLRVDEGNGQDEIAMLASTFNNMLSRLESAFKMQKTFIANASHELRTPLTAIVGQLEVLAMKERTEAEYKKTVISVLEDIRVLMTVANRLLLLAQASSETASDDFEEVRVDDVIWQAISGVTKQQGGYKVVFTLEKLFEDEQKLIIKGNEQLLRTVFTNLIENGCKYSEDHDVRVEMTSERNRMVIYIRDNGMGIPKNELKQIFEPFNRGSNAIHHRGHGIGLSLVKRILDLHKGHIRIQSKVGIGTTCIVYLPYKKH